MYKRQDHLNAAEDAEFTEFYETFYVPNNAVLSIAGDFNRKDLKKMIEAYFGPVPKGTNDIPRPTIEEPYKVTEVRDTIWGDDQLPLVLIAYPIPAEGTPDYYAVDLLNTALSGGQRPQRSHRQLTRRVPLRDSEDGRDPRPGQHCLLYTSDAADES